MTAPDLGKLANRLRFRLVGAFGGYTESFAWGGYKADAGITEENVRVFDVACDASPQTYSDLIGLASWLAREARQDCIYLRLPTGIVYLIDGSAQ